MTSYDVQYKPLLLSLFWFSALCFRRYLTNMCWKFAACSYSHVISTASLLTLTQFSAALWRSKVKSCSYWNTVCSAIDHSWDWILPYGAVKFLTFICHPHFLNLTITSKMEQCLKRRNMFLHLHNFNDWTDWA